MVSEMADVRRLALTRHALCENISETSSKYLDVVIRRFVSIAVGSSTTCDGTLSFGDDIKVC